MQFIEPEGASPSQLHFVADSEFLLDTFVVTLPNNTAVNKRDRDGATKTPLDQNENRVDIGITADIRIGRRC